MNYKANIILLLIMEFFSSIFFIKVIQTLFYQNRGLSLYQLGFILGAYQFSKIIFEIPTGIIADKFGRKYSMIIGSILFEFYLVLTYYSNSFEFFIFATFLQGLAFTFISGADTALFVDSIIANNQKSKIYFYLVFKQFVFYMALAFGALLGGFFANIYSYDFVFIVQIVFFSLPIFILLFIKEPPIIKSENLKKVSFKSVLSFFLKKPILIYLIFVHCFIAIAFIPIDIYYPNYLIISKLSESVTGTILFVQQILSAIIVMIIVKKIALNKMKAVKFLPIGMMILLLFSFTTRTLNFSIFLYFLAQFCFILVTPYIFTISNDISPSEYRATIGSFFSLFLSLIGLIMYIIFGYYANIYGLAKVFIFLIIISLILLLCNILFLKGITKKIHKTRIT